MRSVQAMSPAKSMERTTRDIRHVVAAIRTRRDEVPSQRSLLVGITGIDASGKGYLTERIVSQLERQGARAVGINVDGWLNLPHIRFHPDRPAEHFYEYAIRFEDMFQQLILPLRENRRIRLVANFAEETATAYRDHLYHFEDVDIIVLEGIFLLKRATRFYFDLCVWVDCTFETALERALKRGQEGLPLAETIRAYHTIYFPAQRIHVARDNPRAAADLIINNDPRIAATREDAGDSAVGVEHTALSGAGA
jgi:uridine kinase